MLFVDGQAVTSGPAQRPGREVGPREDDGPPCLPPPAPADLGACSPNDPGQVRSTSGTGPRRFGPENHAGEPGSRAKPWWREAKA